MVPQLVQMLLQGTMRTGVSQDLVAIKVVSRRDFVVDILRFCQSLRCPLENM